MAAFLERALAFFAAQRLEMWRVLTDSGNCYRSRVFSATAAGSGLIHWRTRPYRPQTNGKAGVVVKILQNGWAYRRPYDSTGELIAALLLTQ